MPDPLPAAPRVPASPLLLLIEDEADSAELLAEVLQYEGFRVHWAACAEDAVSACDRQPPDLVLTDLNLKDVHGTVLAQRLRREGGNPRLPIWALTGHAEAEVRAMAGGDVFERVVQKPVDIDQLLQWLNQGFMRG